MTSAIARRAPARLDFGGGWTDVPPYCDREGGFVCNVAITRHATVRLAPAEATRVITSRPGDRALVEGALRHAGVDRVELALVNDFPVGAGLGGSSAAGVAIQSALAAWRGETPGPTELAERSRTVEIEELGVAGGRQDHYAAAYGGALALRFSDRVEVERIPLSAGTRAELERRAIVVYTGESRISGDTITAVLDAYRRRERRVCDALERMKGLAEQMAGALRAGDLDSLGSLVGEHWTHQRALHPAIPTPRIDTIIERACAAGAIGAKALGASGGGCVLVIAGRDGADAVRAAVASLGDPLPFAVDEQGVSACS